jgi:Uncharacterized protein conserved in bacteria (DUF2252)
VQADQARAQARSGDPIAISEYLGRSGAFDRSITGFPEGCADQNERDFPDPRRQPGPVRLEALEGV